MPLSKPWPIMSTGIRMHASDHVELYGDLLGLYEWTIATAPDEDFDEASGEEAYIFHQDDERKATVYVHPAANDAQSRRLVCHELLHLVLADLVYLASNGRSPDVMDAVSRATERAISQIVGAITLEFDWEPIYAEQRKAHGLG